MKRVVLRAEGMEVGGTDLPAEDCRAQLSRILESPDFDAADRKHRFLSYVVNEHLSGRGDRIKAYSIAVEVFGRDASFDPQADPIVRVEAGHLRRALERYYLTAGQTDPIVIAIPKGAYVPTFSRRRPTGLEPSDPPVALDTASPPPQRSWRRLAAAAALLTICAIVVLAWSAYSFRARPSKPETPRLLVEWFDDLSGTEESAGLARGLTQEIVGQLSKFKDVVVILPRGPAEVPSARYVLAGSVDLQPDRFRILVRMLSRADGSVLWAHSYDGVTTVSGLLKAQADVAANVATNLAQAYGVIFEADARLVVPNPPEDWAAYACTLSYYSYRISLASKERPAVRACLERAVKSFPSYATAWALLSQIYIDEIRFSHPLDPATFPFWLDRALAAADRAVELEPLNVRGLQAQMFALYFRGEIAAALDVGSRAMALNPNDTELMGEYGYRLALSGKWDDGCALVNEARDRNPGPLAYYETALAMCSYFKGDYQQAAMWIKKANGQRNALYHAIAAAIFAEGGYKGDAESERAWLMDHEPALVANAREEIRWRLGRPEDVERFLDSLKKAGLDFH